MIPQKKAAPFGAAFLSVLALLKRRCVTFISMIRSLSSGVIRSLSSDDPS